MKQKLFRLILVILMMISYTACSVTEQPLNTIQPGEEIQIKSASLTEDGKWRSVITVSKGDNLSPQLSWTPVESAACYAIYMVDISANNWCHWIAKDVKVTNLALGEQLENSQYIGPYPPSGVHVYEVMIFALKASPDEYLGKFDGTNASLDAIIEALDSANGNGGNILAKGTISGTYKSGDVVE